ncbi:AgmX/PglI C-terminal domain-containing protein [Shewanella sedimentimangrovi]|uniref:AgmX/PglI C-terminal domain-containing protein n=1 Tax=Shewanella sedimentimangrovi TaxID=2814293 RepID=A0ABX7R2W5_9GAMM|nr:AgmX/PglI C-terminal domain-containing protein [Shewanella sedimentimangrovi]QSX38133.1 AgmX/PglI C-terminal domain-containing protein [Shewanella sedimentimangrovi]
MSAQLLYPSDLQVLPWAEEPGSAERLLRLLLAVVGIVLLVFVFLDQGVTAPPLTRDKLEEVPQQLAKVLMLEKQTEPAKPVEPEPLPEPLPEPQPEPELVEQKAPEPEPRAEREKPKLSSEASEQQVRKAREKAARSGVMAAADSLKTLRQALDLSALAATPLKNGDSGDAKATRRDLITAKAKADSGGIAVTEVASVSTQLAGVASSQITQDGAAADDSSGDVGSSLSVRTQEEIALVFDRNKTAFYSLYLRALRSQMGLRGRFVFELEIQPDGSVSRCELVSSELGQPELERKLLARIRLLNFGPKAAEIWHGKYHIDFAPSV